MHLLQMLRSLFENSPCYEQHNSKSLFPFKIRVNSHFFLYFAFVFFVKTNTEDLASLKVKNGFRKLANLDTQGCEFAGIIQILTN